MRRVFADAAAGLKVVNLKGLNAAERKPLLAGALKVFAEQYPNFADPSIIPENDPRRTDPFDPEMVEDFSGQLGTGGFMNVVIDKDRNVLGLAAGVVYPEAKACSYTYFAAPEGDDNAVSETLQKGTRQLLNARGVKAEFQEFYYSGNEAEDLQAQSDERDPTVKKFGLVRVPVTWRQPSDTEGNIGFTKAELYVRFAPGVKTAKQMSELTSNYIKALTEQYDPGITMPYNTTALAEYKEALKTADWDIKSSPKRGFDKA